MNTININSVRYPSVSSVNRPEIADDWMIPWRLISKNLSVFQSPSHAISNPLGPCLFKVDFGSLDLMSWCWNTQHLVVPPFRTCHTFYPLLCHHDHHVKSKSYNGRTLVVYHWIALVPRFCMCWDIRLNWRVLPITQRFCCNWRYSPTMLNKAEGNPDVQIFAKTTWTWGLLRPMAFPSPNG